MFLNALTFIGNLWWWSFRIISVAWKLHIIVYIIKTEMNIYFCKARSHCDRGLIAWHWRRKRGSDKKESCSPSLLHFSVCKLSTLLQAIQLPLCPQRLWICENIGWAIQHTTLAENKTSKKPEAFPATLWADLHFRMVQRAHAKQVVCIRWETEVGARIFFQDKVVLNWFRLTIFLKT